MQAFDRCKDIAYKLRGKYQVCGSLAPLIGLAGGIGEHRHQEQDQQSGNEG
jgi:hypothetical protein